LNKSVLRNSSLAFLGVGSFDARYVFGCKISDSCIFLGLQYEAPSDPLSCVLRVPPGDWHYLYLDNIYVGSEYYLEVKIITKYFK